LFIGAFAEVRLVVNRETGAQRALKIINKSDIDEEETEMILNEMNILKMLVFLLFIKFSTYRTIQILQDSMRHLKTRSVII
jgi:serine/threonine protein kinase